MISSSPAASRSGRSPRSTRTISSPSSVPRSLAALPCALHSASRIAGGRLGGAAQERGMDVGRAADQMDRNRHRLAASPDQYAVTLVAGGNLDRLGVHVHDRRLVLDLDAVDLRRASRDPPPRLGLGGDEAEPDQSLDQADLARRPSASAAPRRPRLPRRSCARSRLRLARRLARHGRARSPHPPGSSWPR